MLTIFDIAFMILMIVLIIGCILTICDLDVSRKMSICNNVDVEEYDSKIVEVLICYSLMKITSKFLPTLSPVYAHWTLLCKNSNNKYLLLSYTSSGLTVHNAEQHGDNYVYFDNDGNRWDIYKYGNKYVTNHVTTRDVTNHVAKYIYKYKYNLVFNNCAKIAKYGYDYV